jgi:uncharacterized protein YggE
METFLKDKKISISVFVLIIIVSLFTVSKLISEIKIINQDQYIGNSISVEGKGEITAIADIASLSININKEGNTAKEAQDLLNESITKTLTYLKDQKVDEKDIKSEYGGLSPKYSYEQPACYTYPCPTKDPKIVGYTATQSITVRVREVDSANVIRTGLADLGITDISGPTFSIEDTDVLKEKAKSLAIKDAKEKAKVLVKDLGVKLGKITSYYDNSNNGGCCAPMYDSSEKSLMMNTAGGVSAPELPKGENKITSSITITYEIK